MAFQLKGLALQLMVFDRAVSLHFYRDQLGFQLINSSSGDDNAHWVLLQRDGLETMLNTQYEMLNRPFTRVASRLAIHADTNLYFGCPDVEATYGYLSALGIAVQPPVTTR